MNEESHIRPHPHRGVIGRWWLLGKRHDTGRPVEWRELREVEGENRVYKILKEYIKYVN